MLPEIQAKFHDFIIIMYLDILAVDKFTSLPFFDDFQLDDINIKIICKFLRPDAT